MGILRTLARGYHNNVDAVVCDNGFCPKPMGVVIPYENDAGYLVDRRRVMFHPSFRAVEGEGIYEYAHNPDATKNFIYHPGIKIESTPNKTISSNTIVANSEVWEDVIITEVWVGGGDQLSTIVDMFHLFYHYWTTTPDIGEYIGWSPFDMTTDRYLIEILLVQLGGVDYEYREVRQQITSNRYNAYLDKQLVLKFKIAQPTVPPTGAITFTGI